MDQIKQLDRVDQQTWEQTWAENDWRIRERGERIILVAEDFDFEVLVAAEWLSQKDIDIKCVRVAFATDGIDSPTGKPVLYATFSTIFPPTKIQDEAKERRAARSGVSVRDWTELLKGRSSPAADFFRGQLQGVHEDSVRAKSLYFRVHGVRRFEMWLKNDFCTVEQ